MADLALQRKNMVESQVRPSDVTDRRITAAMMALPRERFLPPHLAGLAYSDGALALGDGRGLMAPRDFARLIQLAVIGDGDRVLDVGSAGGYSAAVLSRLAREVVALESNHGEALNATATLPEFGGANVKIVSGPLEAGWPEGAPYDVIVVEGALDAVPATLLAQLAPGGRLVAILVADGIGRAAVFGPGPGHSAAPRLAFEASAPRLPGFVSTAEKFVF